MKQKVRIRYIFKLKQINITAVYLLKLQNVTLHYKGFEVYIYLTLLIIFTDKLNTIVHYRRRIKMYISIK